MYVQKEIGTDCRRCILPSDFSDRRTKHVLNEGPLSLPPFREIGGAAAQMEAYDG